MQAKCGSNRSRKSSSSKGVPWDIVATALEIARTLEIECGTHQLDMMNALETALTTRCGLSWWDTFDDFPTEGAACQDSLFAFAVRYGLRLYVRARLRNGGCQSLHKQGRPLLNYACAPTAAPVWVRGLDARIVADLLHMGQIQISSSTDAVPGNMPGIRHGPRYLQEMNCSQSSRLC